MLRTPVVPAGKAFLLCSRCFWLLCLLGAAGPVDAQEAIAPATQLWEQGQAAMRQGQAEEAIHLYEQSLAADPTFTRNHLSLAAAYLEKGDADHAAELARYLEAQPEHLIVRAHYAELLLRLDRPEQARAEFERFAAEAQLEGELHERQLIHCHSRLMELAEAAQDAYAEHLHRGIGLYLLARERAAGRGTEDDLSPEGLLCRAAAELTLARIERPDEAQPCWYLYEVWWQLAQRRPALRCLREADLAAPFSYLTPTEQSRLELACRRHEVPAAPK